MAALPEQVNVLAELERCGIDFEWAGESDVKVRCPFHDDDTASCSVHVQKRVFKCQAAGCGAHGDFVSFLTGVLRTERHVVLSDLAKRYVLQASKVIDAAVVERAHSRVWQAKPLLEELYKRGITDEDVRRRRLGEDKGRIVIPVPSESGLFVNLRRYLPGAPGPEKMRNTRGHGAIRLYPVDQLRYDKILLVGGEIKAIVASRQLNPLGIGAITATAGEGNWDTSLTPAFAGKQVWVCMDVDAPGQVAASQHCARLYRTAEWVGNVKLPLDLDKWPHGGPDDFVAQENGELWPLMEACPEWTPPVADALDDEEPQSVSLTAATHADCAGKRLRVRCVASVMDTAPYVVPKRVGVTCDRSQDCCGLCPIMTMTEAEAEIKVHPESQWILDMINSPRSHQREALMRAGGIPTQCRAVDFVPMDFFNVEDVRISPQLEITSSSTERVLQPAFCIGKGVELNECYDFVGRMWPHPRTQQSTLLISQYEPTQDALSTYECSNLEELEVFCPDEWSVEGIHARLEALYADLESNVTRIYQRRELHLMVDLAYHSPMLLSVEGKTVKGWTEVLILGDSSQGKSETTNRIMEHYGLGEKVECKNASVAGLLGGCQKMGDRWFVTWGIIPTHDRRLVVLEELKGASIEVISKLTEMRSSGIASIPKIEKRRTHARTRLIANSNPRSDRTMSAHNFGVEAIKELVGNPEDIRRFDAALIVASKDVDPEVLNMLQSERPQIDHWATGELCRSLVLWAWTRSKDQVVFKQDAVKELMAQSVSMCDKFTDALPLVDRGSMRHKLARLSAALACRTFSNEEYRDVLVRPCHVRYVAEYLTKIYDSSSFGYTDYTAAIRLTESLVDEPAIRKRLNDVPFPVDFVKQCLHTSRIELVDVQDWCGWDRSDSSDLLSFLVRKHAFVRDGRAYRKTPPFIRLLKNMLESDKLVARPAYLEDFREEF